MPSTRRPLRPAETVCSLRGVPGAVWPLLAIAALVALGAAAAEAGETQPAKLRQVGFCYTGFGVPGSGRPFVFGQRALVNAGEGCPTVIDVSAPRRPRILRHIPTWFFTSHIYPVEALDLAYLSNSRGPLLVLRGLADCGRRGQVTEIPWDRAWGRAYLSGIRPDGVAYTVAGEHILAIDLRDPDHPKQLARIHQPRLKGHKRRTPADLLTFSPDFSLGALVVDAGRRVALLKFASPTEAAGCGDFENAAFRSPAGKAAFGRVLAIDARRVVIGHPASESKYWRCTKLTFWDIRDPARPKHAADVTFPRAHTHVRDVALAGPHAYVLDGRNIQSGHTVRRGQHSRLLALDIRDLAHPATVATFTDPMPTEYSHLAIRGRTLYVNDYNYGLWLFDVSDPRRPVKLGGAPVSAEGHWLYLKDDHAFAAHTFGGTIHVINVADPAKPRRVGTYWDGQWLNYKAKIRGRGRAMYLPQFDGLAIVDIADPPRPKRTGEFLDADGKPLREPCLDLVGAHAFVTARGAGKAPSRLITYDVSRPLQPRRIGAVDLPDGNGYRVLAAGKRLFLVAYRGGRLLTADAADPARPKLTADQKADEVRVGEKAYPLEIRDGGGNGAPGLAFSRGYLYVTTGRAAPDEPYLLIFDVRRPEAIRPAGTFHVRGRKGWQYFICDVITAGDRLIIGDYGCEEVYDVAQPLSPRLLAVYRRSYAWQVGTLRGKYLYVPKLDGLEILQVPARSP